MSVVNRDNPVRVKELLDNLGLSERIYMDTDAYVPVKFEKPNEILMNMRQESVDWINQALA